MYGGCHFAGPRRESALQRQLRLASLSISDNVWTEEVRAGTEEYSRPRLMGGKLKL